MVEAALASHPGRIRPNNEDYAYHGETPQGYVAIVCDGMGGEAAGEVAARLAAEAAFQYFLSAPPSLEAPQLLQEAIQAAQNRLLEAAQQHPSYQNFGTTIALALLKGRMLYYAHVGDSRIYLFSRHKLTLLTEDDSLIQQMLREGLITPEQALHHPQKNILSQALGPRHNPNPHLGQIKIRPNDIILLCTDGLSNLLSQDEITAQLTRTLSLSAAADNLISQANQQGGYDNITVLLLRPRTKTPTFALSMKLPPTKYLIAAGVAILGIILLGLIFSRRNAASSENTADVILITDSTAMDTTASEGNLPPPPESEPTENVAPPAQTPSSSMPTSETPQPPTETSSAPTKTTSSSNAASSPTKTSLIDITVQKGDNLTQIAKAFHTSRSAIQNANNLNSDNIRAGQKLSIPVKAVKMHTVQKGENLSKLAREYHSSIEAIRRANKLSDKDEIKAGQKLKIPVLK